MAAWTLTITGAEWGLVPWVAFLAEHKDGRQEDFIVGRWPVGWRGPMRLGLTIPQKVRSEAKRLAREVWPDECF